MAAGHSTSTNGIPLYSAVAARFFRSDYARPHSSTSNSGHRAPRRRGTGCEIDGDRSPWCGGCGSGLEAINRRLRSGGSWGSSPLRRGLAGRAPWRSSDLLPVSSMAEQMSAQKFPRAGDPAACWAVGRKDGKCRRLGLIDMRTRCDCLVVRLHHDRVSPRLGLYAPRHPKDAMLLRLGGDGAARLRSGLYGQDGKLPTLFAMRPSVAICHGGRTWTGSGGISSPEGRPGRRGPPSSKKPTLPAAGGKKSGWPSAASMWRPHDPRARRDRKGPHRGVQPSGCGESSRNGQNDCKVVLVQTMIGVGPGRCPRHRAAASPGLRRDSSRIRQERRPAFDRSASSAFFRACFRFDRVQVRWRS